jgi:ParB family chromosome partitioning protein
MRRLYEEHSLNPEVIADIMCEQKPNQRERMVFNGERMRKLLPRDLPMNKTEDYICEAIAFYRKHNREHEQSRKSSRDAR